MNRTLIFGVGSIGQRHINSLLKIGEKNIAAFRTKKGMLELDKSIEEAIINFYCIEEAFKWQPTHIIISNPTSLHLEYISESIKTNARIFVEKPMVEDYAKVIGNKILYDKILVSNGMVGFNLRFHSLFIEIKKLIVNNKYGRPLTAYFHVGHYLPFWHTYEDYKNSYVAKKNLGGGALRTLSHEIDLTRFFFGSFKKVFAKISKLSNLEINTDDTADLLIENVDCPRTVIHLDLLNPILKRCGHIYFEKGLLEYDFITSKIEFTSYDLKERVTIYDKKEDYNLQYIRQMNSFLYGSDILGCSFKEGLEVAEIIYNCEKSDKDGIEICLN